jgi:hypothetical protein
VNLVLTPLKFLIGFVGATLLFWVGIAYVVYLPAGWPNYKVAIWTVHAPWAGAVGVWRARYDQRLRDDAAATAAAKGIYTAAIKGWATLGRAESAKLATALQNVRVVHDRAAAEIHNYVTPEIDRRYSLPWSLVRLHDAYALGFATPEAAGITLPAGQGDGDPSPFKDSDLAGVLNDNYTADKVCRAELKSWQDWYPQMAATWSDAISHWPKVPPPN